MRSSARTEGILTHRASAGDLEILRRDRAGLKRALDELAALGLARQIADGELLEQCAQVRLDGVDADDELAAICWFEAGLA